ncbi:MAG: hypothetical protein AB1425_15400 [Actinomycetota bacterium]
MGSWEDLAGYLAGLSGEDRDGFSRHAALDIPEQENAVCGTLRAYAAGDPAATPSVLLAATAMRAAHSRDLDLARRLGAAALEFSETVEERQLAHVALAQAHFQNRRDEEELSRFEEHCLAAVELGHAGTFCYERLAALYEFRGQREEAARISRRAAEVLRAAGDERAAARFERRLRRLSGGDSD